MLKGITNRVKILFLLAVLTGALAVWSQLGKHSSGKPVYEGFAAIDTMDIVKVSFTAKGETMHYVAPKNERKWFIDSKYEVRSDIIALMKVGLARMDVKMPVSEELRGNVKTKLLSEGVHVQVQSEEGEREFWVLTNDNDKNSSYYLSSKDAEPYIVHVPGFTGDLTDLFRLKAEDWRNKALFRSVPGSIEEIKISYILAPSAPKDGFTIKKEINGYQVIDMPKADSTKLYTYLGLFQRVNVDNYLVDKQRDSVDYLLKSQSPKVILEVIDIDKSRSRTLQIYNALPGNKLLYARIVENGELVSLNPESFFRILVRKQWFLDK
ncbi:MAG: DUF4340 domain-containing protein [Cytophagales bacterium]|nr:DUF4340 domain-containing protein [Cytophaga sp.]